MGVPETIFQRVREAGFTIEAACALLAQIQKESWFKSENLEDAKNQILGVSDAQYVRMVDNGTYPNFVNDAAGFGLAQWTERSRKQNLLNYCKSRGKSIGDLDTQIGFLLWEMKSYFGGIWKKCLTSHDLRDLTWVLLDTWENPAEKTNNMVERYGYAQSWFKKFSNQNGSEKEANGLTKQEAVKKVLDLARSELGYREKASSVNLDDKLANAGGANWTKYARDLDRTNWYNGGKNGYAWCDVFVDWLFFKCFGDPLGRNMICQPAGSAGAGCLYSAQYYKNAGKWHTNSPQAGDQIFFTYSAGEYSHTGIVEQVNGDTVTTIEGNTSDSVGRRNYNIGSPNIAGYGTPKWELAANASGSADSVIPTPSEPTVSYPLLKQGAKGEYVKKLQEMLVEAGYSVGPDGPDGDFGTNTYYAVRRFQIEHNLEVDGECGDNTWAALEKALKKEESPAVKPDPEPVKPQEPVQNDEDTVPKAKLVLPLIRENDEGPEVKLAQSALLCWGYSILVHGIFGKEMTQKVKDFQEKKGLDVDGEIGNDTWAALLKISR